MTGPDTTPKKKFRRRAEARPDEVLDAALEIFIAKGFSAARVEDIARAAGLSKGTVYLYFPSKDAILEGLVKRAIVPLVERATLLANADHQDPRKVLETAVTFIVGALSNPRNAAIPRLILSEAGNFPELANMYRAHVIDAGVGVFSKVLARGVKTGVFRPVDPKIAVRSVIGPVLANVLLAQVFGFEAPDPQKFAAGHLDILMNGLASSQEKS